MRPTFRHLHLLQRAPRRDAFLSLAYPSAAPARTDPPRQLPPTQHSTIPAMLILYLASFVNYPRQGCVAARDQTALRVVTAGLPPQHVTHPWCGTSAPHTEFKHSSADVIVRVEVTRSQDKNDQG
ncbi:hypothetical protein FIBSPDRAFT_887801 [Athelia psychrophila]|uniref:Uncharacterized protein n=1 Tax=Athelia psychrophila TaxID=1759441 RepID=A0A166P8P8_9AGAM|nr:hypothetical protein FIBSPDRAFT_887801 [Fibularhizoctonia sp. CBS 109695]